MENIVRVIEKTKVEEVIKAKKYKLSEQEVYEQALYYFNMPERYSNAFWDKFLPRTKEQEKYRETIKNYINNFLLKSDNLIFTGSYGTGKTYFSFLIANSLYQSGRIRDYYYTKTSHLLSQIKGDFNKSTRESYNKACEADLLILDEFSQHSLSEFEALTVYNLIDDRYNRMQPTIFISNLNKDELLKTLDKAVISRVFENVMFLDFGNTDLRLKK